MFGFEDWDDPVSFVIYLALSILLVIGLLFIVRRVNANAEAERRRFLEAEKQAKTESDREQNDEHDRLDNK
ncbi:MAG TPA: hypothetical protein VLQ48_16895 [Chloroflexia bacterium]|nr:hypothetical protein [Chloroflexia bacterium]